MPGFLSLCDKKLEFTTSEYSALFSGENNQILLLQSYFSQSLPTKSHHLGHDAIEIVTHLGFWVSLFADRGPLTRGPLVMEFDLIEEVMT